MIMQSNKYWERNQKDEALKLAESTLVSTRQTVKNEKT